MTKEDGVRIKGFFIPISNPSTLTFLREDRKVLF